MEDQWDSTFNGEDNHTLYQICIRSSNRFDEYATVIYQYLNAITNHFLEI